MQARTVNGAGGWRNVHSRLTAVGSEPSAPVLSEHCQLRIAAPRNALPSKPLPSLRSRRSLSPQCGMPVPKDGQCVAPSRYLRKRTRAPPFAPDNAALLRTQKSEARNYPRFAVKTILRYHSANSFSAVAAFTATQNTSIAALSSSSVGNVGAMRILRSLGSCP